MKSFSTTTTMLSHQCTAVDKVSPSRIGALLMGMGTGKSRTGIELVHRRMHKIDKVVWFCPVSLKDTVRGEILKHTDCSPVDIFVFDHKVNERNIPEASWYVIGIESLSSSARVILTVHKLLAERTMVILDESSYCKSVLAKRTQRITAFSRECRYRLIMTGTLLSNGIVDMYAQMTFLSPKILGYNSFYSFAANHLEYSDKYPDMIVRAHNLEYLAAKIEPYSYQVTKEECLTLPPKLYETRYFSMTDEQRTVYEEAKQEVYDKIAQDRLQRHDIFRLFISLQKIISGHYRGRELPHRRLQQLLYTLEEIPQDEKVIIWAKYRYDIEKIAEALEAQYGPGSVVLYYGKITEKKRVEAVRKFRETSRFFLATQSAGGYGLTLNEARHAIFYNNSFKWSDREQAEDRFHRIGQDKQVLYTDLHCWHSIDDRISRALAKKTDVISSFEYEMEQVKDTVKELIASL